MFHGPLGHRRSQDWTEPEGCHFAHLRGGYQTAGDTRRGISWDATLFFAAGILEVWYVASVIILEVRYVASVTILEVRYAGSVGILEVQYIGSAAALEV